MESKTPTAAKPQRRLTEAEERQAKYRKERMAWLVANTPYSRANKTIVTFACLTRRKGDGSHSCQMPVIPTGLEPDAPTRTTEKVYFQRTLASVSLLHVDFDTFRPSQPVAPRSQQSAERKVKRKFVPIARFSDAWLRGRVQTIDAAYPGSVLDALKNTRLLVLLETRTDLPWLRLLFWSPYSADETSRCHAMLGSMIITGAGRKEEENGLVDAPARVIARYRRFVASLLAEGRPMYETLMHVKLKGPDFPDTATAAAEDDDAEEAATTGS